MKEERKQQQLFSQETEVLHIFPPGHVLMGLYRVERILGEGGMGRVYLCLNLKLGNLWAVKHIPPEFSQRQLHKLEEQILSQLNHLSLPKIVDKFQDHTGTYLVESYMEGQTLKEKLEQEGAQPVDRVLAWGIQLAEVLAYLHGLTPKPILYLDMKPANVIITPQNRAVLIDFGISVQLSEQWVSIGLTDGFAAPEQFSGLADPRSDIYSLGQTLICLLTNQGPLQSEKELKEKGVAPALRRVLLKAIQPLPENRHQTALELSRELEQLSKSNRRSAKREQITPMPSDYRKLILCISPESMGKTSLAVSLAWYFSRQQIETSLVDLDFQKRDLYYHFSKWMSPSAAAEALQPLEGPVSIPGNLQIYPISPDQVPPESLEALLPRLLAIKAKARLVLVDVGAHWSPREIRRLLPLAEQVLLVTGQHIGFMNRLQEFLIELELKEKPIRLVINKYIEQSPLDKRVLKTCCSQVETEREQAQIIVEAVHTIPDHYPAWVQALAEKNPAPIWKQSPLSESLTQLANSLFPLEGIRKQGLLDKIAGLFQ